MKAQLQITKNGRDYPSRIGGTYDDASTGQHCATIRRVSRCNWNCSCFGATIMQLSPARTSDGKPLTEALKLRRSTREYSNRPLDPQVLSDLLWSAFGINRPSGDRTALCWRHVMVIDVYAVMANGAWLKAAGCFASGRK